MNFKGKAKRIEDIDLPLIGREIGVGEDEVHAILDVESAGSGFDKQGRPKMLFEPHIFWRELGPGAKRDKATAQGLAYPRWKRDYPADSYPRLLKAMAIDENAALRSASWGLGQIMGFNCKLAGYPTAEGMAMHFLDDEDRHLQAMIRFIKATGLDDELRRHDWAGFARGYNGKGFAKNGYDKKLAAAFARWQKIKDTPVNFNASAMGIAEKATAEDRVERARIIPKRVVKATAEAPKKPAQTHKPAVAPAAGARGGVILGGLLAAGGYIAAKWNEAAQAWSDFWVWAFSFIG